MLPSVLIETRLNISGVGASWLLSSSSILTKARQRTSGDESMCVSFEKHAEQEPEINILNLIATDILHCRTGDYLSIFCASNRACTSASTSLGLVFNEANMLFTTRNCIV